MPCDKNGGDGDRLNQLAKNTAKKERKMLELWIIIYLFALSYIILHIIRNVSSTTQVQKPK